MHCNISEFFFILSSDERIKKKFEILHWIKIINVFLVIYIFWHLRWQVLKLEVYIKHGTLEKGYTNLISIIQFITFFIGNV